MSTKLRLCTEIGGACVFSRFQVFSSFFERLTTKMWKMRFEMRTALMSHQSHPKSDPFSARDLTLAALNAHNQRREASLGQLCCCPTRATFAIFTQHVLTMRVLRARSVYEPPCVHCTARHTCRGSRLSFVRGIAACARTLPLRSSLQAQRRCAWRLRETT
jgi:hypothetical protein